ASGTLLREEPRRPIRVGPTGVAWPLCFDVRSILSHKLGMLRRASAAQPIDETNLGRLWVFVFHRPCVYSLGLAGGIGGALLRGTGIAGSAARERVDFRRCRAYPFAV